MKIQHRPWLLALAPLPALLVFGHLLRQQGDLEVRTAQAAAEALSVTAAADTAAEALIDERRAAADRLSAGEITLDALMVAQDSAADVLSGQTPEEQARQSADAGDLSQRRFAELRAAQQAAARAQSLPQFKLALDALEIAREQLPAQREAMQRATTLEAVLSPFQEPLRRIGDLHDQLALSLGDATLSRLTAARATLGRVRVLAEEESLAVYFPLVRRQLSAEEARLIAELEGRLQWQRRQFAEVFAGSAQAEALAAAWNRADAAGRDRAIRAAQLHARRLDDVTALLRATGYGGLIQHFKNYQQRRDPGDRERFLRDLAQVRAQLERLLDASDLSDRERGDYETLRRTFERYAERLERPGSARIDDAPALEALARLTIFDPAVSTADWRGQWLTFSQALQSLDLQLSATQSQRVAEIEAAANRSLWLSTALVALTLLATLLAGVTLSAQLARGVTELQDTSRALTHANLQNSRLLQAAAEGILGLRADGHIEFANPAACRLLEARNEQLVGGSAEPLFPGLSAARETATRESLLRNSDAVFRTCSGRELPVAYALSAIDDDQAAGPSFVLMFQDISDRKRMETRLKNLAERDPLTGLANRVLFGETFSYALGQAQRHERNVALLYLDLDGFKPVNDVHGHQAGDRLLCAVAERLRGSVRKSDLCARLGGDEFAVLLDDCKGRENVARIADKISGVIAAPLSLSLGADSVQVTGSIGYAVYPEDGDSLETLLRAADAAMYRGKRAGGNQALSAAG